MLTTRDIVIIAALVLAIVWWSKADKAGCGCKGKKGGNEVDDAGGVRRQCRGGIA